MRKRLTAIGMGFAVLLALGMSLIPAPAQVVVGNYGVQYLPAAPSGSCATNAALTVVTGSGAVYTCQNGTWAVSGGSTPPAGGNGAIQYNNNGTQAGSATTLDASGDVVIPNNGWVGNQVNVSVTFGGGGTFIGSTGATVFKLSGVEKMRMDSTGFGIGTSAPKSPLHVVGLPIFANNAAAISGGLTAGAFYRTGGDPDAVSVVH